MVRIGNKRGYAYDGIQVTGTGVGTSTGGAGTMEVPIAAYPNFEHLESEGQRLMPEQLKAMLKALVQSNLRRRDTR